MITIFRSGQIRNNKHAVKSFLGQRCFFLRQSYKLEAVDIRRSRTSSTRRLSLQPLGYGSSFGKEVSLRFQVGVYSRFIVEGVLPQSSIVVHVGELRMTLLERFRVVGKFQLDLQQLESGSLV